MLKSPNQINYLPKSFTGKILQIRLGKTKFCNKPNSQKQFAVSPLLHPRETLEVFAHYKIPVSVLRYYKTSAFFLPSYFFEKKYLALLFQTQYNAKCKAIRKTTGNTLLSGNRNRRQKHVMSFPAFSLCDWINHRVIGIFLV